MRATGRKKFYPSWRLGVGLSALLVASALAPAERLPIKNYTTADGLARDHVSRIVRDSRGFLWFCTTEGVSRFDGYKFTNFGVDHGLPSRVVYDLIETRGGQYWVATDDGLWRLNLEAATPPGVTPQPRFTSDYQGEATRGHAISTILEDHTSAIWCGGSNSFYRLDPSGGRWVCSRVDLSFPTTGAGSFFEVLGLLEDRRGALWVSTSAGLYRRGPDGRFTRFAEREGFRQGALNSALLEDRAGRVWVGTGDGLCQLVPEPEPNTTAVARTYTTADGLGSNHISSLFQAADGTLWVGTSAGLSELLPDSGRRGPRFRSYTAANGLSDGGVGSLAEDRHGNLWLGTEDNGVLKIVTRGFTTYSEADGLGSTRISTLLLTQAGELCVLGGSASQGFMSCLNGSRFEAQELRLPNGLNYWGWGWYQTMFQSRTREWWMMTGQGVVRYPRLARVDQLAHAHPQAVYTKRDGLPDEEPFRIFEDSAGNVWIGTFSNTGNLLARWERQTGIFHQFTAGDGLLLSSVPTAFGEDVAGGLWVGFYRGGLARYAAGRWTMFTSADGVPGGFVRGIYLDHAGRLWAATGEGGAVRIDEPAAPRPRLVVYNTANGLASNQTTCFTEDRWGHIYIGTGRGLDRLDPATGLIKHFTTADGLASNFINVCSCDRQGALWFGTLRGLSRLVPQPEPATPLPPVLISELSAGGALHPLSPLGEVTISGPVLEAGQNQLRVGFFGLSFGPGEVLRYQYKLEGAGGDWSPPSEQRVVNYAGLSPGRYRFLVRAVTADGVLSQTPASVSFKILPPLWRRWWFLALAGLLALSALLAFDRYRVARMKELDAALTRSHKLTEELTAQRQELRKANRTLALEAEVTRILAEAADPTEAAPRILQAICEETGWEWGAIWNVDPPSRVLRCANLWRPRGTAALAFEALTRTQVFLPGQGLPGRVLESGEPYWIPDLGQEENFPRLEAARREGLRSGFGFPVLLGSEVIAVMEFFSRRVWEADQTQISMLAAIGSHIGQLIERKRAEQALRESETRFRTLAETASDAIITINEASEMVYVNQAAETIFGYPTAELVGADLTMLMPEYLRHLHRAGLGRYIRTNQRHITWTAIELPGLHRTGREVPLEISFGEFTRDGRRYFTGIARDVTERKRAEEALRRSQEERLVELERVRRRIATDLHDDIGSSLTQISILSEVLRQRIGHDDSPAAEPLSMIAGASRELVDSMSDIVWAINPQKDHLGDLTQRMRRFASDSFTARHIKFRFHAPSADQDLRLGANLRREIFLIFKESVNNMVRHSGCTEAEVEFRVAADHLFLRLRDNGRGFDTARESDGHGLQSMHARATDMGGEFDLRSTPGRGTTVTLKVPLDQNTLALSQG